MVVVAVRSEAMFSFSTGVPWENIPGGLLSTRKSSPLCTVMSQILLDVVDVADLAKHFACWARVGVLKVLAKFLLANQDCVVRLQDTARRSLLSRAAVLTNTVLFLISEWALPQPRLTPASIRNTSNLFWGAF